MREGDISMKVTSGAKREPLLDPVDRISEVLFGLIMAVTFVGAISIATAGRQEVRTAVAAALGCNLAWGLVDAVMYVVRTMATRTRNRTLAKRVASVDPEAARHLIADALPDDVASVTGPDEIEGMRGRLLALRPEERPLLRPRDFAEALGVFLWVVAATFPVAVPFLLTDDVALAMRASQATTLAMLFLAGLGLGRYAGHPKPFRTGTFAAAFGAVLIAAVKALGG
jgi:VIT1/CCC1 family predicted Fe2+/Mn2+ transporter